MIAVSNLLYLKCSIEVPVPVQLLSHIWLFVTQWAAACQASLSITNSQSLPKPMSIDLLMPSNLLVLYCPLLLLPSIFPSIRVFSNESALHIMWPKYWSSIFNISPSNELARVKCRPSYLWEEAYPLLQSFPLKEGELRSVYRAMWYRNEHFSSFQSSHFLLSVREAIFFFQGRSYDVRMRTRHPLGHANQWKVSSTTRPQTQRKTIHITTRTFFENLCSSRKGWIIH